ncbi:hypothetical protein C0J52_26717 [Blattella germanica]|nr:hypothetical protein C0J52_26717 [Blattella germanica]
MLKAKCNIYHYLAKCLEEESVNLNICAVFLDKKFESQRKEQDPLKSGFSEDDHKTSLRDQ